MGNGARTLSGPLEARSRCFTRLRFIPKLKLPDRPSRSHLIGYTSDEQGLALTIWHTSRLNFNSSFSQEYTTIT